MKKILLTTLYWIVSLYSSQYYYEVNEYDVKNIPSDLMYDTDLVVRKDEVKFEVEDYRYAQLQVKYAVTIFSKDEQKHGRLKLGYDKFQQIDELEGTIYNSNGEVVRELEDSDIEDYSDFDGYTIYSDNRIKFIELYYDKFPYTLEYKYEISYDGYLGWPNWYSRSSIDPVEYSVFEVSVPKDYKFRYWCNKSEVKPYIENIESENKIVYSWEEKNLLKLGDELEDEDLDDYATIVRIAPSDFEIDGYRGNMDSWKDFGLWYFNLYNEKDILPENATVEVKELLHSSPDTKEKILSLYQYFQSKTRYVSVQFGIGGWQPFDAAYVYKNGYGDCKALSNYMVALLSQAGIPAYPVLIRNGHYRYPLIQEFPSNQFNHVLVCVPSVNDTIWLECTSQVIPAGCIGWSNENRNALMITPEGGKIIHTPVSSSEKNFLLKKINVHIDNRGAANVNGKIKWSGNQHDYVIHVAQKSNSEEKVKWIKRLLEVPDVMVDSYNFLVESRELAEVDLDVGLKLSRYCSISGKRMFFNPDLIERRSSVPKDIPNKLSPVRFRYPYTDIDSIWFELPKNYTVEAMPEETEIETSFGRFGSKSILIGENILLHVRSLEISKYSVPPENYAEYQKFFADVVKVDKQQVVLVKGF